MRIPAVVGSLVVSFFLLTPTASQAATFVWDGGGSDDNWSTAANWNPNGIPGSTGSVVFNGTSTDNALIDTNTRVLSVSIGPGYTGTITQSGTLMVGTGGFIQGGGTFSGGSAPIMVQSNLTLTGGTLLSTSSILSLSGTLLKTGGTFSHNNGTVSLASPAPRSVSGSLTFYRLDVESTKETGLVGHLKFDEAAGIATADSSGNGNNGTLTNGPVWIRSNLNTETEFPNPAALYFDGVNDFVSLGDRYDFVGESFTICTWANPGTGHPSTIGYIFGKFNTGTGNGPFLRIEPGSNYWDFGTSVGDIQGFGTIERDTWQHLCVAFAPIPGSTLFYRNGLLARTVTTTGTINDNAVAFTIGNRFDSGRPFDGMIDDFRIYNRILSAAEIAELAAGSYPTRTGGSTLTLGSDVTVTNALKIHNGVLAVGSRILSAVGAVITNFATITQGDAGKIVHPATLTVSPSSLNAGERLSITLTDGDANIDGTSIETVTVSADGETITLTETAAASGVFAGSIATGHGRQTASNGVIEHDDSCSFQVTPLYRDQQDTSDTQTATVVVTDSAVSCEQNGGGGGGGGLRQAAPLTTRFNHSASSIAREPSSSAPSREDPSSTSERISTTRAFLDVPTDSWFSGAISLLKDLGIAKGYEDGLFRPANEVTIAEALTLLLRAAKIDLVTGPSLNQSAQSTWAQQYVATGESMGVPGLEGDVHTPATRGMIFRMMTQIFGYPLSTEPHPFIDLPASHPAVSAIQTLYALDIVMGDDGTGTVRPDGLINRAELSVLLMRVVERVE